MYGLKIGRRVLVVALAVALAIALMFAFGPLGSSSQPFDGMNTGHKPNNPGPSAPACGLVGKYNKHPQPTCTK